MDRALVIVSALNEAAPKWNQNPDFHPTCFESDAKLAPTVRQIYGANFLAPVPPGLQVGELSTAVPGFWTARHTDFLRKLRAAFYSSGLTREAELRQLVKLPTTSMAWDASLPQPNPVLADAAAYLNLLATSKVGCLYGHSEAGVDTLALVLVAQASDSKLAPFLVEMETDSATAANAGVPASIRHLAVYNLRSPANSDLADQLNGFPFRKGSICFTDADSRSTQQLLDALLKTGN